MRNDPSNASSQQAQPDAAARASLGSQTLLRGLDVIEAVVDGPVTLADLASRLGLTRSTAHRLATALIERRYITFTPRLGYLSGPKLLELGFAAQRQTDIVQVARPHLESLAASTEDTVHIGVRDRDRALYLDKIPGRRRVEISSRVGDRQPLTATGLGKALLLDDAPEGWAAMVAEDRGSGARPIDFPTWQARMQGYVAGGHAYDLEENEDLIRCVAAPVRDASGRIVGAISVSSAAQYMDDERMAGLTDEVRGTAQAISLDLGWSEPEPK
ncbi:IclR family transcriptional regulator [Sphingomonas sp. CFBP 13728]|uniref:IclR family transcriptional regulator n=1 Tax=Sphingomonas sp. CFBP 13728 TaxID=2775294 RepID=UPI0017821C82|nr:IclR family transcriptional regulator [Sphingomonas sp. CFBP 13728]MBD8618420.1 IclR family transcriptional regulator [Sphingomonas sp. CFBP 13728]